MEILLVVLAVLCLMLGFAGCVAPVLPGVPLAFVSLILLKLTAYGGQISWNWVIVFGVVVIISMILDYVIPAWGAKKFGGTKAGIFGAIIGTFAGIFFLPAGIILGPFLGAFAGEIIAGKNAKHSLKAAFGTFVGFLAGVGLKLIICFWISAYIIWKLFF